MSDDGTPKSQLDAILAALSTLTDQVIRLDQNVIVLAGRLDAIEHEVTGLKPAITQLQRALVEVARDVQDIRQRLFDESARIKRLELLQGSNRHA